MPEPPFNIDEFNEQTRSWGRATNDQVKAGLFGIGARRTGQLLRELKVRTGLQFGRVFRISFSFPRQLVWLEKGASKGYGGRKGSRWTTRGTVRRTSKESLGKMGTGRRIAHRIFNSTMDKRVPILAALVARYYANASVKAITLK